MNTCDFTLYEKLSSLLTSRKEEKLHGGAPATSFLALENLEARGDGGELSAAGIRPGHRQVPPPGRSVDDSERRSPQRCSVSSLTSGPTLGTTYHSKMNAC